MEITWNKPEFNSFQAPPPSDLLLDLEEEEDSPNRRHFGNHQERSDDNISDKVSYAEYDMTEDDILMTSGSMVGTPGAHRHSPESIGDTDSAIVAPPSESGSASPDIGRKAHSMSDGEERFESYGEEDPPLNSGVGSQTRRSPQPFQRRTTWLRTSLRRSPGEKRRLSSNSLASQLYRSSSFNCGRNSSSGESDDIPADFSLEEDIIDINQKVHMLQQQVTALAHTQNSSDDKYTRVKQENAVLQAKVTMLEEQVREVEMRAEERLKDEQKRCRELITRIERDKCLEVEALNNKILNYEKECSDLKEEIFRQRTAVEKLKQEKYICQDQLSAIEFAFSNHREEHKKYQDLVKREREELLGERINSSQIIEELTRELKELQSFRSEIVQQGMANHKVFEMPSRCLDLEEQLQKLKEENQSLRESKEELEAQLFNSGIQEGRNLLCSGITNSLAAELEAMSKDEVMETLREQREVNAKLRAYIDGILLNIMEHYPALLEVKTQTRPI